jgi:SpoVK/Ycf46/Vps4 family AAA+-type ATPase
MKQIPLKLDIGKDTSKARAYVRNSQDVTLGVFLGAFPARAREPLPQEYYTRPLRDFHITWVNLGKDTGVALAAGDGTAGQLRQQLDSLYAEAGSAERTDSGPATGAAAETPTHFPEGISDNEAVQIAYRTELQAIAKFLRNDLSVLVACDKILTEHIFETVCHRADRKPVLEDAAPPEGKAGTGAQFDRALQGPTPPEANLPVRIRNLKDKEVLVLRSLDLLDNPALIEVLYQGSRGSRRPQLLGFLDPSLEVKKVLTDRFAVHFALMGLPRFIQPDEAKAPIHTVTRLLTADERRCFRELDPEGLYKNVSGLNAVQFRNAMRYVGATVGERSDPRHIYDVIRQFKRSSSNEIEIPDTTFDDIGGYDRVKQELQRLIHLVAGRVEGLDERARQRLIPRGFIFHGPPGTGKTLFAKAIANEMNATIQMVSGPEIMDKYVGQSETNLRHIFATARRNAPSVVVFDEFDSIASQRSTYSDGGSRANNAVVAQLLTELDGFRQDQAVVVIGTTNRLDIIDEALLRPSRLKPIEIGLPEYAARRSVAAIHAKSFGVDALLGGLCELALRHAGDWDEGRPIPEAFLEALFSRHPAYQVRYDAEQHRAGFVRDLREFYAVVRKARAGGGNGDGDGQLAARLEEDLVRRATRYGLDLTRDRPADAAAEDAALAPMRADLRDLLGLLRAPRGGGSAVLTPEAFVQGVLDLAAEYTDGFNNDEIRAVFQEASLEYQMDGQLVTPRYLGMKVGLIKTRRDEREVTHLSPGRGRR